MRGYSFFALNLVGVLFLEVCELGVPIRDTVGRWRFVERGEENMDAVGDDICIARTDEGVRNGGRVRTLLGVRSASGMGCI